MVLRKINKSSNVLKIRVCLPGFFGKTFGGKFSRIYLCRPLTGNGSVVQLVRMPPCHGGGRGFESRPVRFLEI